jgi:hypothetical protein
MSNYFGSDSTGGGIQFQFRAIKKDAKRQRQCFNSSGDPRELGIGVLGTGKGQDLADISFFVQHVFFGHE